MGLDSVLLGHYCEPLPGQQIQGPVSLAEWLSVDATIVISPEASPEFAVRVLASTAPSVLCNPMFSFLADPSSRKVMGLSLWAMGQNIYLHIIIVTADEYFVIETPVNQNGAYEEAELRVYNLVADDADGTKGLVSLIVFPGRSGVVFGLINNSQPQLGNQGILSAAFYGITPGVAQPYIQGNRTSPVAVHPGGDLHMKSPAYCGYCSTPPGSGTELSITYLRSGSLFEASVTSQGQGVAQQFNVQHQEIGDFPLNITTRGPLKEKLLFADGSNTLVGMAALSLSASSTATQQQPRPNGAFDTITLAQQGQEQKPQNFQLPQLGRFDEFRPIGAQQVLLTKLSGAAPQIAQTNVDGAQSAVNQTFGSTTSAPLFQVASLSPPVGSTLPSTQTGVLDIAVFGQQNAALPQFLNTQGFLGAPSLAIPDSLGRLLVFGTVGTAGQGAGRPGIGLIPVRK